MITNKRILLPGLFLLVAIIFSPDIKSQKIGNWELLGYKEVNFSAGKEIITVTPKKTGFRAMKLRVLSGSINMYRFVIFFGSGSSQEVSINKIMNERDETIVIDLAGTKSRNIKKIEFRFDKKNNAGPKTIVQAWGVH